MLLIAVRSPPEADGLRLTKFNFYYFLFDGTGALCYRPRQGVFVAPEVLELVAVVSN